MYVLDPIYRFFVFRFSLDPYGCALLEQLGRWTSSQIPHYVSKCGGFTLSLSLSLSLSLLSRTESMGEQQAAGVDREMRDGYGTFCRSTAGGSICTFELARWVSC